MLVRRAIRGFRRYVGAPVRRARPPSLSPRHPRQRPEFPQVNARVGIEPVRPELSGLRLHYPPVPRRVTRLLIHLAYRWHPSGEYRKRQVEMRLMNQMLRLQKDDTSALPPILSYTEQTDIAPVRVQPILDPSAGDRPLRDLPRDLTDLESVERLRRPRVIQPRLSGPDPDYLLTYRPLLPRQYRHFLRYSPYPRVVAGVAAAVTAVGAFLWVSRLQQAEAVAAGRARVVRHTFEAQLVGARSYGLDARDLRALAARARGLGTLQKPVGLVTTRSDVQFYYQQVHAYAALLRDLHRLERRALRYWTWREGTTYAALVSAIRDGNNLGLEEARPAAPACSTPACYRRTVRSQAGMIAWLQQTGKTLRAYGGAIAVSPDPASAAGSVVQEADNLAAVVPRTQPPVAMARVDGLYATASDSAGYAQAGSLAHLDRDALEASLVRALPERAITISTERGTVTCYEHGRAVFRTAATAGSSTPTGVFHIQDKESALPALYWNRAGYYARYRYGSLVDWMPFSGEAAMQGAPWRISFGPDGTVGAFAPSTPGSVDLPPAAAGHVFRWAAVGTEVVVF